MNLKSKKKGSITDVFYILVFLFIFGICSWLGYLIYDEYNTQTQDLITSDSAQNVTYSGGVAIKSLDWIFLFIIVLLTITTLVLAFMLDTHPILFFGAVFVLMFAIIIGGVLSDAFEEYSTSPEMASSFSVFKIMHFSFSKMPFIILLIGALIMIALFVKWKFGYGGEV